VDGLRPTFSWTPADSGSTKYDLEVCVGVPKVAKSLSGYNNNAVAYGPGERVYYREGIEGTSHHLEQSLSPSTVYVWSVRTRNGDAVGPWSTYNFHEFDLVAEESGKNLWWPFITPGSNSNDASGQPAEVSEGQGRIYFYREKRFVGSGMEPHVRLNFKTVGNSMNGGYFYLDRPPGNYVVVCPTGRNESHEINFTLGPGETKYVQTRFESFHITPSLQDKDAAVKAISGCTYMPNISQ
jgi:hypothetical protein